jgi:hypothetical protein
MSLVILKEVTKQKSEASDVCVGAVILDWDANHPDGFFTVFIGPFRYIL